MNRFFLTAISMAFAASHCALASSDASVILDLSKASTELSFNPQNGSWTGTYDDDTATIDSQCFSFIHSSMSDWQTWWGFTASVSADNSLPENTLTHQWSNMAAGGILLNDDGTVKLNGFGAPEVSAEMPYLVAFYSPFMSQRPVDMVFNDGKTYIPQSVYVNLNSYTYYSITDGDSFARAFTNGDSFILTIHGVAPDETEKTVDVYLASSSNGDLTITRGWKLVDLSSLGIVNELYFTLKSTDSGAYGDNTPLFFCMDKLCVVPAVSSEASTFSSAPSISYDRSNKTITLADADFAIISDASGAKVMTADTQTFTLSHLPDGVYVIRTANATLKIVL